MVKQDARQQAFDVVKEFCETLSLGGRSGVDFYKMLWVAHWGVENFGPDKVHEILASILENLPDESVDVAEVLRDRLFSLPEKDLSAWFQRAMKV